MDLVDLDRVLDEFEAKEELHTSTIAPIKPSTQTIFKTDDISKSESTEPINNFEQKHNSDQWAGNDHENGSHSGELHEDIWREDGVPKLSSDPEPSLVDLTETNVSSISAPVLEPSSIWAGNNHNLVPLSPYVQSDAPSVKAESPSILSPVPPPDITKNGNPPSIIDQEPEDPKSSVPAVASKEEEPSDQMGQHPPPDVVAAHKITRSGSSTPSPTPVESSKRPIGFYDDDEDEVEGPKEHVTEEELEQYLSELEKKIGEHSTSDTADQNDQEGNRKTPSSEELKMYLENLEKLSGDGPAAKDGGGGDSVQEEAQETPKEEESGPPVPMDTATVEEKENPDETSVQDAMVKEVQETSSDETSPSASSSLPRIEDSEVVVDSQEHRSKFHHDIEVDDEDVDEEDPYVMLAFSPHDGSISGGDELQQNLKSEIEQALLASSKPSEASGPTQAAETSKGEESVPDGQASIELSSDSFEDCLSPEDIATAAPATIAKEETAEESKDKKEDHEAAAAGEVEAEVDGGQRQAPTTGNADPEATQQHGPEQERNGAAEATPGVEATAASGSTGSRGQLVTVCRLDPSPSTDAERSSESTPLKLTESELQLGRVQPVWIPDNDSSVCMLCESKFTLIRRRHHCRACGRVLCNVCCNQRAKLPYMASAPAPTSGGDSGKQRPQEARVCTSCFERLKRIEEYEKQTTELSRASDGSATTASQAATTSDQNAGPGPSTVAGATVAAAGAVAPSPPPRPPVLKREGSTMRRSEPKQVMFSDGIKPGGDLTETPSPSTVTTPSQPSLPSASASVTPKTVIPSSHGRASSSTKSVRARELESFFSLPGTAPTSDQSDSNKWPPMMNGKGELIYTDDEGVAKAFDGALENKEEPITVTFALKKNLRVLVRLTEIDCCLRRTVWCFATDGLRNVSQDDVLIVIECVVGPETSQAEAVPPLDIFVYFNILYEEALKGKPLGDLSYTVFSQSGMNPADPAKGYFGSKDNAGFLHFRPTYQCLQNLCLPEQPFLVGVLIQKSEVSWAKVMPLRLLLRLGVEYRYYPYPLISDRSRKALFYETGHTIMNLLTDMRNFTYTLPAIAGCTVALEDDKTIILIPIDQYNQVLKILQSSNEHVLAWAASLHKLADAHLVCVQQPDALTYTSQTINRENHGRKITGACFVVFNASMKAGGPSSRISIVEDGLMIQIRPEAMERLRQSLHQQQPFELVPQSSTGEKAIADANTNVEIKWIPMAEKLNRYVLKSRIDGRNLTDAPRYRLHGKSVESTNGRKLIRLIELYLLRDGDDNGSTVVGEPDDLQSMVRQVATACGTALLPFVDILDDANMRTIAVRFAMGADLVEYSVGSNEQPLADPVMAAVDDVLIPLLHSRAMGGGGNGTDGNLRFWRVELVMRLLDL